MGRSSPAPLLPPVAQHLQQSSPMVSSPVSGSLSSEPPDELPMSLFLYPLILFLAAVTFVFFYYLHKTRVRDRRLPVYLPQQDRPAHPTTVPNLATKTDVLEVIPVIVYSDGRSPAEVDEKESCAICLDNFEAGGEVGMMPRCSHMFHPACLKKWWLYADCKTCPLCRAAVIAETAAATEP
ncbi:RING-H2 finger protein ATL3F [Musa troglodytarum]|uniref:RING-type E3 ubiquitin transferase n=1 Tax=Musa troglodytarum TaxID=320322 RepID=A0A9E7EY14_9LILI|nr:RING-H2 finger protein ATL3F [Musa troglodytarum]